MNVNLNGKRDEECESKPKGHGGMWLFSSSSLAWATARIKAQGIVDNQWLPNCKEETQQICLCATSKTWDRKTISTPDVLFRCYWTSGTSSKKDICLKVTLLEWEVWGDFVFCCTWHQTKSCHSWLGLQTSNVNYALCRLFESDKPFVCAGFWYRSMPLVVKSPLQSPLQHRAAAVARNHYSSWTNKWAVDKEAQSRW